MSGGIFDTVALDIPAQVGASEDLFLNIQGKSDSHTNLKRQNAVSYGQQLNATGVSAQLLHWSGDVARSDAQFEGLEVRVAWNNDLFFAGPLLDLTRKPFVAPAPRIFMGNDDLTGQICARARAPWAPPVVYEFVERPVVTTRALRWPERVAKIANALSIPLPYMEYQSTQWVTATRPAKSVYLVRVRIDGELIRVELP